MKKIVLLFFLGLLNITCFGQHVFLSKNNLPKDTLEWNEKVTQLEDIFDIIRFFDANNEEFHDHTSEIPMGYPLDGDTDVSSHFGMRKHPIYHTNKFHKGIDLRGSTGDNVFCTASGIVDAVGLDPGLGKFVTVKHPNGFVSIYGHLSKIMVKKGTRIECRQLVGKVGATGKVTGPHLHYTIKKNGITLDPFELIYLKK